MVSVAPLLIVSAAQVYEVPVWLPWTEFAPVVAMMTVSPATGTTPPTHVVLVPQTPPVAVLVIVAARTGLAIGHNESRLELTTNTRVNNMRKIFSFIPKLPAFWF
jgi:hypothetical protein